MSAPDFRHHGAVGRRSRRTSIAIGALVTWFGVTACGATQWNGPAVAGGSPPSSVAASTGSPSAKASPHASPRTILSVEDACIAHTLARMSQKQMIGQIMLVGTPIEKPSGIDKVLTEYDIGGVFLDGRTKESASTLRSAISSLQSLAPKDVQLLVSLDQEGGEVQSLQGPDFPPIPTAVTQGKESSAALKKQATAWAKKLAAVGINLDLAPVSDTVPASIGTKNPPIGAFYREYGYTPTTVSAAIKTVVPAVQSTGVVTTLKHFPGLGRVLYNTDFSTKAVDNVATTHDPNLGPFITGIKAGTGAVMISSAKYPKIDSKSIATFSEPIITGLLRNQLGFKGLIVSDAMGGAAAVSIVPVSQRAVDFIQAGGDFALTAQYQKAPAMIEGLTAEAKASTAFAAKIRTAAGYVLRTKYTAGLLGLLALGGVRGVRPLLNRRLDGMGTTIFAEMSALAVATGSINLGQGFPDTDGPAEIAEAAIEAIRAGRGNQYPPGPGIPELRHAIAEHQQRFYGLTYDPDTEVLVTAGATEAIAAALLALLEPGDEVIAFEPFYDSYAACIAMAGAQRVPLTSTAPSFRPDLDRLRSLVTDRTRVLLLNSPHNPTGMVLTDEELAGIASIAIERDLIVITDEVYEHLVFGVAHHPIAGLPGMRERTVTISSSGKTFSFTGWKVGWVTGTPELVAAVRTAKQYLTYVSAGPFQYAIADALRLPDAYFRGIAVDLRTKRDLLADGLTAAGFEVFRPDGTYFITTDITPLGTTDGLAFCQALPATCGVVAIPNVVFYDNVEAGRSQVRFTFCKKVEVLASAVERLRHGSSTMSASRTPSSARDRMSSFR